MHACCIPLHTTPNKSHLGEGLWGIFPLEGITTPFPAGTTRLCPDNLFLICGAQEELCGRSSPTRISEFVFWFFLFYILHVSEIIWFLYFSIRLISLSITLSRSIHVVPNGNISSSLMAEQSSGVYIYV